MSRPTLLLRWRDLALVVGANVLFFWQLRHPVIRCSFPLVNDVLGAALGLCLPWLAAAAVFQMGRWWSSTAAVLALLLLLPYSAVWFLGSAALTFNYRNGHNASFELFAETRWNGSSVRLYRANGGATTDYGVVIRQEKALLPGILLVRNIDMFYHCAALGVKPGDSGIEITDAHSDCRAFRVPRREYRLKRFVYF